MVEVVVSGFGGHANPSRCVRHWSTEPPKMLQPCEMEKATTTVMVGGNIFAATVRMWVHDPWTGIKSPAWHVSAL